ncbi:hypothetical protein K501DRAFT_265246 [Backusella circina FSU 941]|nr:hypothetical protein K501DRAFT_265246 [Backusella circina FSU 941]
MTITYRIIEVRPTKSRFIINSNSDDSDTSDESSEDSNDEETKRTFTNNNPGRKHVFTTVTGSDLKNNEVKGCSTKEYCTMTGSLNYQRSLDEERINSNVKKIETSISTGKTANATKYEEHIKAEVRFRRFQDCQRAREEMFSILINGSKKYNKRRRRSAKLNRGGKKWTAKKFSEDSDCIPLVVFGAGMFGKGQVKFKRFQSGVTGILCCVEVCDYNFVSHLHSSC